MPEESIRLCHYCGIRVAGSPEHLPGSSALNDSPVTITYLRTVGSKLESLKRREEGGFVVRTICRQCNVRTGGNYGTAFKDFALQFAASGRIFTADQRRAMITLREIQPLRVLKQMAAMVLAAQSEIPTDKMLSLKSFVRQRDSRLSPDAGRFFLYRNVSGTGRISSMSAWGFLRRPSWPTLICSEVSWPPLGLVYAMDADSPTHPMLHPMTDVTGWGDYTFRSRASLNFSVPQFRVEANWPVIFGPEKQADDWMTQVGGVMLTWGATDTDAPTQISSLIQRHRHR